MRTAIYARKSTDQTGVADEQKSVTRQIDHARAYASSKGWHVDDEHVYVDDGISGAEFANRPGFLRLMNALKPRAPFQVLVMSEESRLGREAIETAYALKQLVQAGVRVFFYLEDRERTLDTPTDKIMMSLTAFADELEREKARQRTYDAMLRKAKAGHVTGGRVFGYDNVRQDTGGVRRIINDAEAAVIRDIFLRCARGQGFRATALALNAVGAPSPRSQQGRPDGWCSSSVREVLHRPLYRGEIVWNKTRKRDAWGQQHAQGRPERDWLRLPAPDLRIVSEEAWGAAHERLAASRATYLRTTKGVLWGKPADGLEAKHLLTGLAQCALCGGGLYVTSRKQGRGRVFFYACTTFHRKGHTACPNNRQIAMEEADWAVMEVLQDELLDPVVVTAAVQVAAAALTAAPSDLRPQMDAIDARHRAVTTVIERLTAAISAGGALAPLVEELKARDRDRMQLEAERQQLELVANAAPTDFSNVVRDLETRIAEWREAASRNVAQARQILRKLLRGRVLVTPCAAGKCELSGQSDYGKLFSGIPLATAVASPTGSVRCCGPAFRRVLAA